jgi:DME family drug/metabolite transporter
VLLAATLWGTLGVTYRLLQRGQPLTPLELAYLRAGLSFGLLLGTLLILRPSLLRVRRADLGGLALYGAISIGLFYWVYAQAISLTTVATAVVLLYTAPAWVTLLAWRLQGEHLQRQTVLALAVTFAGTALVAGVADPAALSGNLAGVLAGLGSGLTYALYSIFGKWALGRYGPWTILVYVLGFGTLALAPVQALSGSLAPSGMTALGWLGVGYVVLGPTLGSLAAYTEGLRRLPASVASILSTWEPAVGALLGFLVLGEALAPDQLAGAGLILAGVMLLRMRSRESVEHRSASTAEEG